MVKHVYSKIRGPLRDRKFFSLSELNEAIHEKLDDYNREPFQRKSTSRQFLFENEEKQLLLPLPKQKFELKKYRRVLVQKTPTSTCQKTSIITVPLMLIWAKRSR